MEIDVARAILRLMAKVLRPIRRVRNHCLRAEHRLDVLGQGNQRRNEWIHIGGAAYVRQAAHFRSDHECIDASGGFRQMRIMQNEPAIRPFRWPGIRNGSASDGEISGIGGSDKRSNVVHRIACFIRTAIAPRRRIDGNPAAPRVSRLHTLAIRIRQRISGRNIHQDERRQNDRMSALFQIPNGIDNRLVRRRTAIRGPAIMLAHHMRRRPVQSCNAP